MTISDEVENAFEILRSDLAKRDFPSDTIPYACLGVAKGIIQSMLIRLSPDEKQYHLDLIRNVYK